MGMVESLRKYLDDKRLSVSGFAAISGIPQARIYKWLSGEGSPKAEDSATLEKILNESYMTKNKNAPEQSEAEPRIMREFLDFLKHQNRDLVSLMPAITTHLASITTNLSSVTVNLKNMEAREAKIEAYAKTILQYAAEVASGGDPEKTQLAMNKLSNLVEVNTMEPIVSNRSSAENKQSKA